MAPKLKFTKIGRNIHMDTELEPVSFAKQFQLKSGRTVAFDYIKVAAADVGKVTYVDDHNIRIGEELTRESLAAIIESIKTNQFQLVIAQKIGDNYSVLDGSRRRQAAIFAEVGLEMLYCSEQLNKVEVKQIVKDISTFEKFSLRDLGRYFAQLLESDESITYNKIAEMEGLNKGVISKAISAWSVPVEIIGLFPIPRDITYQQFAQLSKIIAKLAVDNKTIANFVSTLEIKPGSENDEVFQIIVHESNIKLKPIDPAKPLKIVDIDKNKWVKTKKLGDKQIIELSRMSLTDLAKIEEFIVALLSDKTEVTQP